MHDQKKFPIGKFIKKVTYSNEEIEENIQILREFPSKLRNLVEGLTDEQLDTSYREGSWTIRQLVHHCADSHINSMIRFKGALTEKEPTIKAYEQDAWALLPDYQLPIEHSLTILDGIHARLSYILSTLKTDEFSTIFHHPEMEKPISLAQNLALYAWHSEHHLAQIRNAKL